MAGETPLTLVGNAVEDVTLRFTPGGQAVASFRVASTPRTYDKQSNTWRDGEPLFLTVNAWRQMAENAAESITKGCRVVVYGVLKSRSYEKDGVKRTVFEVEAEDIAVSVKFATAKVTRAQRSGGQGGGGGQQGPAADPWGSNQGQQGGGWGQAPATEAPPF